MLESMTAMQYREWLTFYKIKREREAGDDVAGAKKEGASRDDQQQLSGKIFRAMVGYQQRRDKARRKGARQVMAEEAARGGQAVEKAGGD